MRVSLDQIVEFGAYVEDGAIVAGWRLVGCEALSALIVQVPSPSSTARNDGDGAYLELDRVGKYGTLKSASYDLVGGRLILGVRDKTDTREIDLPIPAGASSQERETLALLVAEFNVLAIADAPRRARRRRSGHLPH
jgi:hypothetical protein